MIYVSQGDAEDMAAAWRARRVSSAASRLPARAGWPCNWRANGHERHLVFIVCDRGDRYLSTGVFPA